MRDILFTINCVPAERLDEVWCRATLIAEHNEAISGLGERE